MKKETQTITVLEAFDGCNAKMVEQVQRTVQYSGTRDRNGRPQQRRAYVSYKGKMESVFHLNPDSYNGVGGSCISPE